MLGMFLITSLYSRMIWTQIYGRAYLKIVNIFVDSIGNNKQILPQ